MVNPNISEMQGNGERYVYDGKNVDGKIGLKIDTRNQIPILDNTKTKTIPIHSAESNCARTAKPNHNSEESVYRFNSKKTSSSECVRFQFASSGSQEEIYENNPTERELRPAYSLPELHSTLRVRDALQNAQESKGNISTLLLKKLNSPQTSERILKAISQKVTVPKTRLIYKELVSAEVNEKDLVECVDQQLKKRAIGLRASPRPRDPEPQLCDYFNAEEYVISLPVTDVNIIRPFSSVKPQSVSRSELRHFHMSAIHDFL